MRRYKSAFDIFKRELSNIFGDRSLFLISIVLPIFYAFFYGTIYMNKQEVDIPVAVVGAWQSEVTSNFAHKIEASEKMHIAYYAASIEEAKILLEKEKIEGIIYFPENFTRNVKLRKQTDIKLLVNNSRFLLSTSINLTLNEIIIDFTNKKREEIFRLSGNSYEQAQKLSEPINLNFIRLSNIANTYGDYLLPIALILILQQTLLIATAESFAKENQENKLFFLIRRTNNRLQNILLGKGIIYLFIFSIYAAIYFHFIYNFFGLYFREITFTFFISIVIYLFSIISMGFFFGSFFKKKIYVLQILVFSTYPLFFIAGVSFPIADQPIFYQWISRLFPSTPFYEIFFKIGHFGANINEVLPQLLNLILIGILSIIFFYTRMWYLNNRLKKRKI
ncbi:MAG: hypothetical protein CR986_10170 [Ignavibacteriae bacterium]|nr:MAG: hypothetical protein CR986_10170 [Ignavibacteriota bacterium]